MSGPVADRDPGLQPERTRLAWRRTTLACTVAAVLAVRQVLHRGLSPLALVAVALCAVVWLAFLAVAQARIAELGVGEPTRLAVRTAVGAAVCVVALVFGASLIA
jgi:hypothetical protein